VGQPTPSARQRTGLPVHRKRRVQRLPRTKLANFALLLRFLEFSPGRVRHAADLCQGPSNTRVLLLCRHPWASRTGRLLALQEVEAQARRQMTAANPIRSTIIAIWRKSIVRPGSPVNWTSVSMM